jgi:hypothetical protein
LNTLACRVAIDLSHSVASRARSALDRILTDVAIPSF